MLEAWSQKYYLLVGTYTAKTSEGIYVYRFDTQTGDFEYISTAKGIKNPSFLVIAPNQKYVYSVGENQGGTVNAFSFDKNTGRLALLNSQSSEGAGACHIATDHTGRYVLVGNYGGGNLSILPINTDGSVNPAIQTIQHEGSSVNPSRQEKPHVHSINIAPNNRDVFVPDLGIDKIMAYHLDTRTGKLSEGKPPFVSVIPGAGPRHFTFHPNSKWAYVIQELNATITAFSRKSDYLCHSAQNRPFDTDRPPRRIGQNTT